MNYYSYCAIAFFIPQKYLVEIVRVSKDLSKDYGSWYVLSEEEFPPHITSWIAYIPNKNLNEVNLEAEKTILSVKNFSIRFGNISIQDSGYISIEIATNSSLMNLHLELLHRLNKWREGYIPEKYLIKMSEYSRDQQESINKYGTRMAGKFYNPHVTVGVIKKEYIEEIKKSNILSNITKEEFIPTQLTFFKQKEEGKSIEVIKRFNFVT